jgi:group II intron reverse transcriptase/maturase
MWDTIFIKENLLKALKRVEMNKGAAGSDGMTTKELRKYLRENWKDIKEKLDRGEYHPAPLRRKEIPKPQGGTRQLGIPTVLDRFIQQAITQALTPIFEPQFSPHSFGYRLNRSAHMAVKAAKGYIQEGFECVVDIDLEKFFDRVNHDILMAKVARKVKDKRTLTLIRKYLTSGVMINGVVIDISEGTPQGGPLSPLLANIMLDDLDHELEKRGHPFVLYADDMTIFVKSKRAGERVLDSMRRYIQNRLRLKVNEKKSAVDLPWRRKILGFSFYKRQGTVRVRIAKQAIKKFKAKIRKMTRRTTHGTITEIIQGTNIYLTGWSGYFHLAETNSVFMELDEWVRHRLRQIIWKRWKRGTTRFRKLVELGIPREKAAMGAKSASYWKMSNNFMVKFALNNTYWDEQGLKSILTCVVSLRKV